MEDNRLRELFVCEYDEALQRHYPHLAAGRGGDAPFEVGTPDRYQKPTQRPILGTSAWVLSTFTHKRTIAKTYKGLLCHKPPIDRAIYSALLWEVKPKTIIELGSFHGGSGLWFADQMEALCDGGEVHSFDALVNCISPRAQCHPRLRFHYADLNRLDTIDAGMLAGLRHPWLVVDDAHVNVLNVLSFMRAFMDVGDYFVKEDTDHLGTCAEIAEYLAAAESMGFLVDSLFADAFGVNYTSAQNAWFVLRSGESHSPQAHRKLSLGQ